MLKFTVNNNDIFIKPKPFEGTKNTEFYENQIYKTLSQIGITKNYVQINILNESVQVNWSINNQEFSFICSTQENPTKNLGAISQAIQDDIRQITRGIKTLDLVMKQYKVSENPHNKIKKTNLMNFKTDKEELFNPEELKLSKEVNEELDSKYNYLLKENNDKLDILYLKFKEECRRANTPNHPLLIALKIVRQQRGLKL